MDNYLQSHLKAQIARAYWRDQWEPGDEVFLADRVWELYCALVPDALQTSRAALLRIGREEIPGLESSSFHGAPTLGLMRQHSPVGALAALGLGKFSESRAAASSPNGKTKTVA